MANLKQLSLKPERLIGGHRLCPGCGASVAVRQILMASEDPVVIVCATGCLEVATTIFPYTSWDVPFCHSAFENSAATASGIEASYEALKKKGRLPKDSKINFVAFGGDGGTYDIGLQSLSGALERGHRFLYVCYDNEAYMNCLGTNSMIYTEEGLRKITDIKVGDMVYAFNQKTHELVLKECSGVFDNGIKDVYRLETLHHSIEATDNHPFLVRKRNGRGKNNSFIWKTLGEIEIGDEVVTAKNLPEGKPYKFKFTKTQLGDYKVNRLNEINLPNVSSPQLMKYLGLYVGDGWIRTEKGEVGFALPEKTKGREAFLGLYSEVFGTSKLRQDKTYLYVNSVNLAKFIESLNFGAGARQKTIPNWIFTLSRKEKDNFLEGLMLSDGYKHGNSWRYVSASEDLLKSLRLFLQTMNYRVGKIHWQEKKKGTQVVNRELLKDSKYGYICFSKRNELDVDKYPSQNKYRNLLVENEHFETVEVKKITHIGKQPTLDLRVEDEHNFIADGIVVHNTGIQRSGATPKGATTTTKPAGAVSYGKDKLKKDLTEICVSHNIPYVAQCSISHWNDTIEKAKKAFAADGPAFLNILASCNRGWRVTPEKSIEVCKLAVETHSWPLYEVINGEYRITSKPREKKPVEEYLKIQGRFSHLFTNQDNAPVVKEIQADVDKRWERLERKVNASKI